MSRSYTDGRKEPPIISSLTAHRTASEKVTNGPAGFAGVVHQPANEGDGLHGRMELALMRYVLKLDGCEVLVLPPEILNKA